MWNFSLSAGISWASKDMEFSCAYFDICEKYAASYPNAYAKVQKWIFVIEFPRNRFELGIIGSDFQNSTICYPDLSFIHWVQNPKNPRIQPSYQKANAKAIKWILDVQFPGNRFELGIIGNDFQSSTIWAIQKSFIHRI